MPKQTHGNNVHDLAIWFYIWPDPLASIASMTSVSISFDVVLVNTNLLIP